MNPDAAAAVGMTQALRAERVQVWKRDAERWLDGQHQGRLFAADDLVAAIGLPDVGQGRNNVVGAWINAQQRRQRIEFTGRLSKSSRVEGRGNMQRLWRVKDERAGGDAEASSPFAIGVSSSPSGSTYPTQKAEASTAPEASEGWDDQADPEQTCDGGHGQEVAPTGSVEGARAEAALTANDGEGDPGSALNADAEPGWLLRSLQAEEAA